MKKIFSILIASLLLVLYFTPSLDAGGPFRWNSRQPSVEVKEQKVDLAEAPEDGNRPWRIVFTSEAWQQDELEYLAVYTLEQIGDQDGQVRPQHITPKNPLFQQYEAVHNNDLPCIVVLVPDVNGGIAAIPTNIHGSTMPLTSEGIYKEIRLSADADDIKGRLFNWHESPFWFGPNRRKHRNGYCPVCQGWHPRPPYNPNQPQPTPPQRITRLPRIGDTITGKRLDKLEEMGKVILKKLEEPAKKIVKEVVKEAIFGPQEKALAFGATALLGILGGVFTGIRRRATDYLEEE